jgi:hypothetical protein
VSARPAKGDAAYDPATGRVGVVQCVCSATEMCLGRSEWPHARVAYLRPAGGGREWLADPDALTFAEAQRDES